MGQASRRQIPSILEFNGIWPIEAEEKGYTIDEVQRFAEVEFAAAKLATKLVCVGSGAKQFYEANGVDAAKIHVIPNGADPHVFRPMERARCRERLGLGSDDKIIGFSGSLQSLGSLRPFRSASLQTVTELLPAITPVPLPAQYVRGFDRQMALNAKHFPQCAGELHAPQSLFVDSAGTIYLGDEHNHAVRVIRQDATLATLIGNGTRGYSPDGSPAHSARLR